MQQHLRELLDVLHQSCLTRRVITFGYAREDGERSSRSVRPLALVFWRGVWTLSSWCELRKSFRTLVLEREFVSKRGQRLEDYLRKMRNERPLAGDGIPEQ